MHKQKNKNKPMDYFETLKVNDLKNKCVMHMNKQVQRKSIPAECNRFDIHTRTKYMYKFNYYMYLYSYKFIQSYIYYIEKIRFCDQIIL